jgi:hypothetical protein
MILYKKLTCDNLARINEEIHSYIQTLELDHDAFWNPVDAVAFMKNTPLFQYWLLKNGLPIRRLAVTVGTHDRCCEPHTDTPPSIYKLSWPVLNTEHTWNRWFKPDPECGFEINALGGTSYLDMDRLEEIDRMRVDSPAIIATGVPHDVWFEPNAVYPRFGLQCQLFSEPRSL